MNKVNLIGILAVIAVVSCAENDYSDYRLPQECNKKCEIASDMNSFKDAIANSAAGFSNCICVESGLLQGDVLISKSLNIIGKSDGSSNLKKLSIFNTENVKISDISFSGITVNESALHISRSSVVLDNIRFSNIKAGSLFGGRGIVVSGGKSDVIIKNLKIDGTDGTGLLINGFHNVTVSESQISNCGFAGIWVQNSAEDQGILNLINSELNDNGAVSLQILGSTKLEVKDSKLKGIKMKEINMEVVGDGIVIKNSIMTDINSVVLENVEISGFKRAGVILDGENGAFLNGVTIHNLLLNSDDADFGVVVQNGKEKSDFRDGIVQNPFKENDSNLSSPLFIITTTQEIK